MDRQFAILNAALRVAAPLNQSKSDKEAR